MTEARRRYAPAGNKRRLTAKDREEAQRVEEKNKLLREVIQKSGCAAILDPEQRERERLIARHEAAHAVAVLAVGAKLTRVAVGLVRASPRKSEESRPSQWLGGLVEHEPLQPRVVAFVALCGAAAHRRYAPSRPMWHELIKGPAASDYETALCALRDLPLFDSYRVEGAAWLFVHERRRAIEALAEVLLIAKEMSGDAVMALVEKVDPGVIGSIPIDALISMHDQNNADPPSER